MGTFRHATTSIIAGCVLSVTALSLTACGGKAATVQGVGALSTAASSSSSGAAPTPSTLVTPSAVKATHHSAAPHPTQTASASVAPSPTPSPLSPGFHVFALGDCGYTTTQTGLLRIIAHFRIQYVGSDPAPKVKLTIGNDKNANSSYNDNAPVGTDIVATLGSDTPLDAYSASAWPGSGVITWTAKVYPDDSAQPADTVTLTMEAPPGNGYTPTADLLYSRKCPA